VIVLSPSFSTTLFWAAAIVALGAQAMVLRAAFAGRTPASGTTSGARARELLWILLPAVALLLVLWFTWQALPHASTGERTPASARAVAHEPQSRGGA
jgi:hypothetical protein